MKAVIKGRIVLFWRWVHGILLKLTNRVGEWGKINQKPIRKVANVRYSRSNRRRRSYVDRKAQARLHKPRVASYRRRRRQGRVKPVRASELRQ